MSAFLRLIIVTFVSLLLIGCSAQNPHKQHDHNYSNQKDCQKNKGSKSGCCKGKSYDCKAKLEKACASGCKYSCNKINNKDKAGCAKTSCYESSCTKSSCAKSKDSGSSKKGCGA